MTTEIEQLAHEVTEWPDDGKEYVVRYRDDMHHFYYTDVSDELTTAYSRKEWAEARAELSGNTVRMDIIARNGNDGDHYVWVDNVNRPTHYQLRDGYEVYDLRQDLARQAEGYGVPLDQYSDWDRALEYVLRMWGKNGLEDAKKGRWYLDKLIEKLEENDGV